MNIKILSDAIRILTAILAVFVIFTRSAVGGVFILITVALSLGLKSREWILIASSRSADWWEFFTVLLFLANGLVVGFGKYEDPNFMLLDIPLHFWGGVMAGWWAWLVFGKEKIFQERNLIMFAAVLGLVALVGVGWEFFEWIIDQTLGVWYSLPPSQLSLDDTLADLMFDLFGGLLAVFIGLKKDRKFVKLTQYKK